MDTANASQINQQGSGQQSIPNSTAVLVLGILSIVTCWCMGLVGLILGIIALVLSNKAKALDQANPGMYTAGSRNNLKAGRICGIIGISLSALYTVYVIIYFLIVGAAAFSAMPWDRF